MKKLILFVLLLPVLNASAEEIQKELKFFNKVIASPRINVVLTKGEKESIKIVYDDVSKSKINFLVSGKTLQIYLDDARRVEKQSRYGDYGSKRPIYEGVSITAYITYTELESLEIRGEQELTCLGPISSDRFFLKAYGANRITLAGLRTEYFKASLYGENKLTIQDGKVLEQKYRLFGENKINAEQVKSAFTTTSIFGEGKLSITSTEEVRVNAFGEPEIEIDGGANVQKRLVFGRTHISYK